VRNHRPGRQAVDPFCNLSIQPLCCHVRFGTYRWDKDGGEHRCTAVARATAAHAVEFHSTGVVTFTTSRTRPTDVLRGRLQKVLTAGRDFF
jgi:hypothetical protein